MFIADTKYLENMSLKSDRYEQSAVAYLKSIGEKAEWLGGGDSHQPDIRRDGDKFSEVKMSEAQGAQFLANYNGTIFQFGSTGPSVARQKLIDVMNRNPRTYQASNSFLVSEDQEICFDAVREYYSNKGVDEFMTQSENGEWIRTKLDDLCQRYTFKAIYRNKKSGSRKLPLKDDELFDFSVERREDRVFALDRTKANTYPMPGYFINEDLEIRKLASRSDSCILFEIKFKS